MGLPRVWSVVVAAIVLLPCSAELKAQFAPSDCGAAADSSGDVSIHLSTKGGKTVFREGEIIPLDAAYTANSAKKYGLNTQTYDRGGRLNGMETFCVEPAEGVDPLADYFMTGMQMGGMFGVQGLSTSPLHMPFELNEWKTLPPGKYRLSILSQRVAPAAEKVLPGIGATRFVVRSNSVKFEVVAAEPKWQEEQLAAADRVLDSQGANHASNGEKEHAARVLRFLGSDAAARDLVERYWSNSNQPLGWQFAAGLYGSPHRATAIAAMKGAIWQPHHPVTQDFIETLTRIELANDPKFRMPMLDKKNRASWEAAYAVHSNEFQKRRSAYLSEAMAALAAKTGKARAVTLSELLQSDLMPAPEVNAQWRQMLLESWATLPLKQQNVLMQYRWEQVGGPEWLPLMLRIATSEGEPDQRIDRLDRGAALTHVYEMSPEKGRALLLKEIDEAHGDIWIDVLGLLPDRELPQFDSAFVRRLQANQGRKLDYQLLDRYASAAVLPEVRSMWEARRDQMDCVTGTPMLRYFLRVSPDYGVEQVAETIRNQHGQSCRYYLRDFKEYIRAPKMEQLVIDTLDNASLSLAESAAEALQQYGSAKAETALWARLEKLHAKWKDKPLEQLHPHPAIIDPDLDEGLENALVKAITDGQSWFTTQDTLRRLKEISSATSQTSFYSIDQILRSREYRVWLAAWPSGTLDFHAGWYSGSGMAALKEKLAQLPPGSHLKLGCTAGFMSAHKADVDEVSEAAKANGQLLEIESPGK